MEEREHIEGYCVGGTSREIAHNSKTLGNLPVFEAVQNPNAELLAEKNYENVTCNSYLQLNFLN